MPPFRSKCVIVRSFRSCRMKSSARRVAACCALAAVLSPAALAQPESVRDYPNKPVRWILAFPAGGVSDIVGRTVGQKLGEAIGQQVVIDNRPGASGIVASELAAKAPPDGYTIILGETSTHSVNVSLFKSLPYDPVKDFTPITLLAESPLVLVVGTSLTTGSVKELIDTARSRKGTLNYASGGTGTGTHLVAELFKSATEISLTHVPYKGTPLALTDLLGGRVDLMFPNLPPVIAQIKSGRLKAMAVTSAKRLSLFPELPTMSETIPGFVANTWYGVLAPANTPRPVVTKLNAEITKSVNNDQIRDRLAAQGFEVATSTPQGLAEYIRAEIDKWKRVVREAGITPG